MLAEKKQKAVVKRERKFVSFAIISGVLMAVGAIIAGYTGIVAEALGLTAISLTGIGALSLLALIFTVFLMSSLFFGRLSFLAMFMSGFLLYPISLESTFLAGAVLAAFVCAGYGGRKMGETLHADFSGEGNFYERKNINEIVFFAGLGMLIGIIGGFVRGAFLDVEAGINVWGIETKQKIVEWLSSTFRFLE